MRLPGPSNQDPAWHRHADAEILFHYTDWSGLVGILNSRCLWATDVRYLNDTVEFEYARRLAVDKLREICERQISTPYIGELSAAIRTIQRLKPHIFAASLAVGGDLLSLWRGYCQPRQAFAIEFERRALQRSVKQHGCRLECVVYSPGAQWACLDVVEMEAVKQRGGLDPDARKFAKAYEGIFIQLAPFLKSPEYFEEGEWRIVSRPGRGKVRYRDRDGARIPYVSIPIFNARGHLLVKSILIGPDPGRAFGHRAVKGLCDSLGFRVSVHESAVPFRWK